MDPSDEPAPEPGTQPPGDRAAPVLVACGHGTREPAGRRALARLRLDTAALRPGLPVVAASIDVQRPSLSDAVTRFTRTGRRCVVVPLLLSAGYHVRVDVARAVADGAGLATAAAALGPDPVLVDVLADRVVESGITRHDAVVLAAAGSSDPAAIADVERVAADLARRLRRAVPVGYLSGAPSVQDVVQAARVKARSVTVVTFLLAPGFFTERLRAVRAERITAPMAPHPALAALVLSRYDAAVAAGGG